MLPAESEWASFRRRRPLVGIDCFLIIAPCRKRMGIILQKTPSCPPGYLIIAPCRTRRGIILQKTPSCPPGFLIIAPCRTRRGTVPQETTSCWYRLLFDHCSLPKAKGHRSPGDDLLSAWLLDHCSLPDGAAFSRRRRAAEITESSRSCAQSLLDVVCAGAGFHLNLPPKLRKPVFFVFFFKTRLIFCGTEVY